MKCMYCGCTDTRACPEGCYWFADRVCSNDACVRRMVADQKGISRNHPVVNGRATTFVDLGKRLGIDESTARRRYSQCEQPVTMQKLKAWDRVKARRQRRDANIKVEQRHGWLLRESGEPRELTPQRVHQIARTAQQKGRRHV